MSNHRYQLQSKHLKKMNFRLLYITTARYDSDWHSTIHSHYFTELFYVIQGKGSFIIENISFPVKADDLIIVNANVSHTEVSNDEDPLEYIALGIDGLQFQISEQEEENDYSVHNYRDYKHEILFYLKTLVQEIEQGDEENEHVCQNLLEVLIINMMRRTKQDLIAAPAQKTSKECIFIEKYILDHYTEDVTLDTLSTLTFMNKYHLVHTFKKYKGVSPINFLIEKRIDEAKNLLESTNYSIAQISDIIGFSSQSYFSQLFRKITGQTPLQYRKTCHIET